MRVIQYEEKYEAAWDSFVLQSRNSTFHNTRLFLGYHRDRFTDLSLMVLDDHDQIITVIAINIDGKMAYSHTGLTYAGFVFSSQSGLVQNLHAMSLVFSFLKSHGLKSIYYKVTPTIYHLVRTEDDLYFLFLCKAQLVCRHVNPVILPNHTIEYQERRIRSIKKARARGVRVEITNKIEEYWSILEKLLGSYNSRPVHTLLEIRDLLQLFSRNIKLYGAFDGSQMVAGVLVFESDQVAKMQYIASSEVGKTMGALDILIDSLIKEVYKSKRIDFGTVTGNSGLFFSQGLSNQKEGFGARASVHDHYVVDLDGFNYLHLSQYFS